MRWILCALFVCGLVAVISAKKQLEENLDPIETENKEHGANKYSKSYQKSHHRTHKHKKQPTEDIAQKHAEMKPQGHPIEVPEPELKLQSDLETSRKSIDAQKKRDQTEDLHLQDLSYEESLKKDKKRKSGHHAAQHEEVVENHGHKKDKKLFVEQQEKKAAGAHLIEDSFEPLNDAQGETEKRNKGKGKKSNKSKGNKKASEKNQEKKSKDGKKKNKDKKNKSKDKKKW